MRKCISRIQLGSWSVEDVQKILVPFPHSTHHLNLIVLCLYLLQPGSHSILHCVCARVCVCGGGWVCGVCVCVCKQQFLLFPVRLKTSSSRAHIIFVPLPLTLCHVPRRCSVNVCQNLKLLNEFLKIQFPKLYITFTCHGNQQETNHI